MPEYVYGGIEEEKVNMLLTALSSFLHVRLDQVIILGRETKSGLCRMRCWELGEMNRRDIEQYAKLIEDVFKRMLESTGEEIEEPN